MTEDAGVGALAGQLVPSLLARSHLLEPGMVSDAIAEAASPLGVRAVRVYLSATSRRHDGTVASVYSAAAPHAISDYQRGNLIDDATIVIAERLPDEAQKGLAPLRLAPSRLTPLADSAEAQLHGKNSSPTEGGFAGSATGVTICSRWLREQLPARHLERFRVPRHALLERQASRQLLLRGILDVPAASLISPWRS